MLAWHGVQRTDVRLDVATEEGEVRGSADLTRSNTARIHDRQRVSIGVVNSNGSHVIDTRFKDLAASLADLDDCVAAGPTRLTLELG